MYKKIIFLLLFYVLFFCATKQEWYTRFYDRQFTTKELNDDQHDIISWHRLAIQEGDSVSMASIDYDDSKWIL